MTLSDETKSGDFISFPSGYLFGVVDSPDAGDVLAADLANAGFTEADFMRFTGEAGAAHIDASGEGHGLFTRLWRFLQHSDESREHAEQYEREARDGRCVFSVRAETNDRREVARAELKKHGGRFINYYSPHGFVEVLDP